MAVLPRMWRPGACADTQRSAALHGYRQTDRGDTENSITGRKFCGADRHARELYLDLDSIEHRRTQVRNPKTNGFVERFNGSGFPRVPEVHQEYRLGDGRVAPRHAYHMIHYDDERFLGPRESG